MVEKLTDRQLYAIECDSQLCSDCQRPHYTIPFKTINALIAEVRASRAYYIALRDTDDEFTDLEVEIAHCDALTDADRASFARLLNAFRASRQAAKGWPCWAALYHDGRIRLETGEYEAGLWMESAKIPGADFVVIPGRFVAD